MILELIKNFIVTNNKTLNRKSNYNFGTHELYNCDIINLNLSLDDQSLLYQNSI